MSFYVKSNESSHTFSKCSKCVELEDVNIYLKCNFQGMTQKRLKGDEPRLGILEIRLKFVPE